MDVNASTYDELERLAGATDETPQGVIREAVAKHLKANRVLLVDVGELGGSSDFMGHSGQL